MKKKGNKATSNFCIPQIIGEYHFISHVPGRQNLYRYFNDKTNDNVILKLVPKKDFKDTKSETMFIFMIEFAKHMNKEPFVPLIEFRKDFNNYYLIFDAPRLSSSITLRQYLINEYGPSSGQSSDIPSTSSKTLPDFSYCLDQIISLLDFLLQCKQNLIITPDSIFVDQETGKFSHVFVNQLNSNFTFDSDDIIANFTAPEFLTSNTSANQSTLNSWMLGVFIYFFYSKGNMPFVGETVEALHKQILTGRPDFSAITFLPEQHTHTEVQEFRVLNIDDIKAALDKLLVKNPQMRMSTNAVKEEYFSPKKNQQESDFLVGYKKKLSRQSATKSTNSIDQDLAHSDIPADILNEIKDEAKSEVIDEISSDLLFDSIIHERRHSSFSRNLPIITTSDLSVESSNETANDTDTSRPEEDVSDETIISSFSLNAIDNSEFVAQVASKKVLPKRRKKSLISFDKPGNMSQNPSSRVRITPKKFIHTMGKPIEFKEPNFFMNTD